MYNPILIIIPQHLLLLLIGVVVVLLMVWFFYPEKGLLSTIQRYKQANQKIDLEHTLKFLFNCEYEHVPAKREAVKAKLKISDEKFNELIKSLVHLDLIKQEGEVLELTDRGRSYSLRIIRVHRIWEQYLADSTGLEAGEWHDEADKAEHRISVEEANKIASKIGNPVFDPHGDPIPSQSGEMPQLKGKSLDQFDEGDVLTITHIEDEPQDIYEQLLLEGLYPGMQIYLSDKTDSRIVFVADGEEIVLTPHFASQITSEKQIRNVESFETNVTTLASLKIGESAEIVGISNFLKGQQRRRLMDLGFITGSRVKAIFQSAAGDPVGYNILGTVIGLRNNQAEKIFIKK